MSNNRRKHPRVRALGVAAHLRGPLGRTPCQVENISIGGLFVRTDQVLDVGTQLEVDLVKPGWKRAVSFFVRVTSRIDPLAGRFAKMTPGMGLQFFGRMDDEHADRLRAILRELGAPEPAPDEVPLDSTELELGPIELEFTDADVDTETPLWQQVQQMGDDRGQPLDAESFSRAGGDALELVDDDVSFPHAIAQAKPRPGPRTFQPDPAPPEPARAVTGSHAPLSSRAVTGSHAPVSARAGTGSHAPLSSRAVTGSHAPVSARAVTGSHEPVSARAVTGSHAAVTPAHSGAAAPARAPAPASAPPPLSPPSAPPGAAAPSAAESRLLLQIRGILLELSEVQQQLAQREAELAEVRLELDVAKGALSRAVKKS